MQLNRGLLSNSWRDFRFIMKIGNAFNTDPVVLVIRYFSQCLYSISPRCFLSQTQVVSLWLDKNVGGNHLLRLLVPADLEARQIEV